MSIRSRCNRRNWSLRPMSDQRQNCYNFIVRQSCLSDFCSPDVVFLASTLWHACIIRKH